jgi:CRP/FNR family transcriptional regulator
LNFIAELQRTSPQQVPRSTWGRAREVCTDRGSALTERSSGDGNSDAFKRVTQMAGRRKISRGHALYREGERSEFLYAVHSGSFKSTLTMSDGCQQVKGFHIAGEFLGLDGVADGRHASSAAALEDSEITMVPYAQIAEPTANMSGFQHAIIRLISREIVRGNCRMVMLGGLNASQRLAAFLLAQSQDLSARGFSAVEFNLKMTRSDIGSFLDLTLETVSRTFAVLQQQRLLTVDLRHIVILDIDGLARI